MNNLSQPHTNVPPVRKVAAGEDLFGEDRVAAGSFAFKVVPSEEEQQPTTQEEAPPAAGGEAPATGEDEPATGEEREMA